MIAKSYNITVLNPEVINILLNLENLNLLKIKENNEDNNLTFFDMVDKLRSNSNLTYEEITEEVEAVRKEIYERESNN